jgi:transketolase
MSPQLAMKPTRDGFGEALVELSQKNEKVVVLSADLSESTRAKWFQERCSQRFYCFGVSEQDMFSAAAGFALMGKIPVACSFGVFTSGRAWDQIRVSICYMNLKLIIGGTHGGISVGADGATHQALEEIALMRTLPNMNVIVPCDALEAKKATLAAVEYPGPVYLRLGRNAVPIITKEDDPFQIGKARLMRPGKDATIIACGHMVYEALLAADLLKKENLEVGVINLSTIKPIDKNTIIKAAKETGALVTAEEHTRHGGMGSAVAEVLIQNCAVPMKMVGIENRFGQSGEPQELMKAFNLTAEDIAKAIKEVLKKK